MLPYNIDFFDHEGDYVTNSNIDGIDIEEDYLSGGDNTLDIVNTNNANSISRGGYVHLTKNREGYIQEHFGYITGITKDQINNSIIKVKWSDVLNAFNVNWCIDTDVQHSGVALEAYIAEQMQLIANQTIMLNNPGMAINFTTTSSTTDWGFNLKAQAEGQHNLITNFKSTIINRALKEYDVAVLISPSFDNYSQTKITLNVTIGKISESYKTIEADLINTIDKSVTLHDSSNDVNRLKIYNELNFNQAYTYLVGADGQTYRVDQSGDTNQQYPVIFETMSIRSETGFEASALANAKSKFKQSEYADLIELTYAINDGMIKPLQLDIMKKYNIIFDGKEYKTIMTGKEIKDGKVKLTFGTNRMDLTKILKQGGQNG